MRKKEEELTQTKADLESLISKYESKEREHNEELKCLEDQNEQQTEVMNKLETEKSSLLTKISENEKSYKNRSRILNHQYLILRTRKLNTRKNSNLIENSINNKKNLP